MIFIAAIFWICLLLIIHSYIIYPFILSYAAKKGDVNSIEISSYPKIYILIAAYNEEKVIGEKLESIVRSNYPSDKISVIIGSDASIDNTDNIIRSFSEKYSFIQLRSFQGRTGKSEIVNKLYEEVKQDELHRDDIIIMTDANVIFHPEAILEMTKCLSDPKVGLCAATIINKDIQTDGISFQEKAYIQRENLIKYREGRAWGTMMGAFGACYAVKSSLVPHIPQNFLMEDFFITLHVLKNGFKAVANPNAICFEDIPNELEEEFKRKVRISAGNFQNLNYYKSLLWPPFTAVAFSFISHKVIRWLGPFLLITIFVTNWALSYWNEFYKALFIIQIALLVLPLIDFLLKKLNINLIIMRFVSYFYAMNLALLVGFFKYIRGVKSNVWKPTKRSR